MIVPCTPNQRSQLSATGALHGGVVAGVNAAPQRRDHPLGTVLTREQVAEWLQVRPRQLDRLGVPCLDLGHKTKRYRRFRAGRSNSGCAIQVASKRAAGSAIRRSPASHWRTVRGATPRARAAATCVRPRLLRAARNCVGVIAMQHNTLGSLSLPYKIGSLSLYLMVWGRAS